MPLTPEQLRQIEVNKADLQEKCRQIPSLVWEKDPGVALQGRFQSPRLPYGTYFEVSGERYVKPEYELMVTLGSDGTLRESLLTPIPLNSTTNETFPAEDLGEADPEDYLTLYTRSLDYIQHLKRFAVEKGLS